MIPSEPLEPGLASNPSILALDQWLPTAAGQYMLNWEQAWIDRTVPNVFGYHAVQIGTPAMHGLRESRIPYKFLLLNQEYPHDIVSHHVVASYEDLPFESQSLDLVVLPHVLEFATDPHQVLREVDRVLIPEGRVIITGMNPLSLFGLTQSLLGRWWPVWPANCSPIALPRLKDWLKLLSFEMELGRFGCYRFPTQNPRGLERYGFMEKAGDRWWPICGAVYMVSAVKRVRGMRLIGPAWKQKSARNRALAPATQKSGHSKLSMEQVAVQKANGPGSD